MISILTPKDLQAFERAQFAKAPEKEWAWIHAAAAHAACFVEKRFQAGLNDFAVSAWVGKGNNGADALRMLTFLASKVKVIEVLFSSDPDKANPAAQDALADLEKRPNVRVSLADELSIAQALNQVLRSDVLVDGMLGTGFSGALEGFWRELIEKTNDLGRSRPFVFCLDVPSGLDPTHGRACPVAIRADATMSFLARKQGYYLADGPDHVGDLIDVDLGQTLFKDSQDKGSGFVVMAHAQPGVSMDPEKWDAHKHSAGRAWIISGEPTMPGAIKMASEATLSAGVGLLKVAVGSQASGAFLAWAKEAVLVQLPELKKSAIVDLNACHDEVSASDGILIGPGSMPTTFSAEALSSLLRETAACFVLDAGVLRSLGRRFFDLEADVQERCVLTPHLGEFKALFPDVVEGGGSKFDWMASALEKTTATLVFKGPHTMVGQLGKVVQVSSFAEGRAARAGMGDVLAGLILGGIAKGMSPYDASVWAVNAQSQAALTAMATRGPFQTSKLLAVLQGSAA